MIRSIALAVARHPIRTLALLLLVTAIFGAFALRVEYLTDMGKMLPQDNPVVERLQEAEEEFGSQSSVMVAMAAPEGGSVFDLSTLRKLYRITEELEALEEEGLAEEVISVANMEVVQGTATALVVGPILPHPPQTEEDAAAFRARALSERQVAGTFVLEDGSAALIMVRVAPEVSSDQAQLARLMKGIEEVLDRYRGPEEFYLTGEPVIMHYMASYMRRDLGFLLPIVILVVLTVLFLSFRRLRGVALPLLVVLVAVIWTMGLISLSGVKLTMISIFIPVLLVAVGSAYGIHVANDYFERAASWKGKKEELIAQVMGEMAGPVFAAALTTAAGFLTLLSAFLPPIREFGLFSACGVLFAFFLSLTLIPAILALLPVSREKGAKASSVSLGGRLAGFMDRRGATVVLVLSLVLFGLFLSQIPRLKVESNMAKYFRADSPIIQGLNFVEDRFGGSVQMSVVIDTGRRDGLKDPEALKFMDALQEYMEGQDVVGSSSSLADLVKETNYTLHGDDDSYYTIPDTSRAVAQVLLMYELGGGEVLESMATRNFQKGRITVTVRSVNVARQEEFLAGVHTFIQENIPQGMSAYTTGTLELYLELSYKLVHSQLVSLFSSLGAVGAIVAALMGSLVAGLISLAPLALAVVGNFGTMALAGANLDMATVMIASIVVGVGVDYSVHVITRYRRERMRGLSHRQALEATYRTAGRAVVYNAVTLTAGFLVLLLSRFGAMSTLGWLVALTMVTSSVGALLVVPAIFGLTNPGFLTRRAVIRRAGRGLRLSWEPADPQEKDERRS
ncbi:MAG: Efflux transporter, putative, hydrophobe/amphiphile efflux-3 (HAE3) family [Acetothermia bacterium 64_32]|nr:MAG: Efflux transporter, putative, hydrophobe/amphiphile efflux-3 (HAE3) family [Acetothermia bacterium 64_32]HAF71023.1 hypothetical protein [Candidatus Acetothermia bacterium]